MKPLTAAVPEPEEECFMEPDQRRIGTGLHLYWEDMPTDWLALGDVIEVRRGGISCHRVRVAKVIPSPDGIPAYITEPLDDDDGERAKAALEREEGSCA